MIQGLGEYLIGRDPHQIKPFTHALYRDVAIKRGSLDFYSAVSGLEIALWDIVPTKGAMIRSWRTTSRAHDPVL